VQAGKLLHYGVSVEKVEEALKSMEYPNVKTVQIVFNMFRQRPADLFFAEAQRRNIGILARLPLSSGMLTGKMTRASAFESGDHRQGNRKGEWFDRGETFSGLDYETGLQAVDELRALTPEGMSLTQMALRWILMFEAVTCAIPGAKRPSQVDENVSAADLPALSDETMRRVREIYERLVRPQVHHYW
jgi:aryl-alcohol dehydrogenase-like predicted oxidoreductase